MAIGAFRLPIRKEGGSGFNYTTEIFLSSADWIKPADLDHIIVLIISAGGGGMSGRLGAANTHRSGSAGFNPPIMIATFSATQLNTTEPIIIGLGSAGMPANTTPDSNAPQGSFGGTTSFSNAPNGNAILAPAGRCTIGGRNSQITNSSSLVNLSETRPHSMVFSSFQKELLSNLNTISDIHRGWRINNYGGIVVTSASQLSGSIDNSDNYQLDKGVPGYYLANGTIADELSPVAVGENGRSPNSSLTFGYLLNRIYPWFDASNAPQLIGRSGGGGGSGNTAGTINGGNGAPGLGFGANGGCGGAATNGAAAGAGAPGSDGLAIIINVFK